MANEQNQSYEREYIDSPERKAFREIVDPILLQGGFRHLECISDIAAYQNALKDVPDLVERPDFRAAAAAFMRRSAESDDLYTTVVLGEALGETEYLLTLIDEGTYDSQGRHCYDLMLVASRYGSVEQIDSALAAEMGKRDRDVHLFHDLVHSAYAGQVRTTYQELNDLYYQVVPKRKHRDRQIGALNVNAVPALLERQYDAVISVMNGGNALVNLLDNAGQPSAYLEWRRGWQRTPVWRNIAVNQAELRSDMKLLLVEDDASTGETLTQVKPKIDRLNPSRVDLLFTDYFYDRSRTAAAPIGFDAVEHASDFSLNTIYSNILTVRDQLQHTANENE